MFIFLQASADEACIVPKSNVKGLRLNSNNVYVDFYPNELLRLIKISKDKKQVRIRNGGVDYWLIVKGLKKTKRPFCELKTCVRLKSGENYYQSPNDDDTRDDVSSGIYKVLSRSQQWYRVQMGDGFVWIKGSQYKKNQIACEAITSEEALQQAEEQESPPAAPPTGWVYGFEYTMIQDVSSKPLRNLLRGPPADPSVDVNDDAWDDPFVPEVKDGTGYSLGLTVEMPLLTSLRSKFGLGYKSRSLEVVTRPNPVTNPSFIVYDDLQTVIRSADFKFIYLYSTFKYEGWSFLGLIWQPGLTVGLDINTSDDVDIEFRTGAGKLTAYHVQSNYQKIEFFYGPRIEVLWAPFYLSAAANFNDYGYEPTFGIGLQF